MFTLITYADSCIDGFVFVWRRRDAKREFSSEQDGLRLFCKCVCIILHIAYKYCFYFVCVNIESPLSKLIIDIPAFLCYSYLSSKVFIEECCVQKLPIRFCSMNHCGMPKLLRM